MNSLIYPESIEQTENDQRQVTFGPLLESSLLSAGLDYYKPTMSQLAYECEPNAEVTFTFHNRGNQRLLDYLDPDKLQQRLDNLRANGWSEGELEYLSSIKNSDNERVFTDDYSDYLKTSELPSVKVFYDQEIDDIAIETTGIWALVSFWETTVMSELNEAYFEGYMQANGLNPFEVYDEGNRRLSEKIAILHANPNIKFADFGTRRHFSLRWQKHVLECLIKECPDNLVGTSNVALANSLNIKPIGTFAHELPMVYAALADAREQDIRASHNILLQNYFDRYGKDYSIALTDTFTSEFFFSDFTSEQAEMWRGVRQDSGDPFEFGERLIKFYEDINIDPQTKTVIFSDGLDIDKILELQEHFGGRINVLFGWGTTLTNDLMIKALNVVMKATYAYDPSIKRGEVTVKIGDDDGKNTGDPAKVQYYKEQPFAINIAA